MQETIHGVEVADPYRWLENGDSAEVRSWTAQQSRLLRQTLDAVPGRKRLVERLWALHGIGALEAPVPKGKGKVARYFYARREGQQNQPVLYWRQGLAGADRVLLDVNALAADGTQSLGLPVSNAGVNGCWLHGRGAQGQKRFWSPAAVQRHQPLSIYGTVDATIAPSLAI